jgi:cytochrome P450
MGLTKNPRANSTIIPCVTWSVLEIARRRQLAEQLTASISRHSLSKSATYNIRDITELGLMKSLLAETVRLRTAAIEVHKSQQDLRLSNEWTVPKDNPIITLWHDVALNTKAWGKARSRTIEQPLENFWPERFLLYDHKGSRSAPTTSQSSSSFSMDGLESLHIRAGSGHQPLLGSEYASMMHAATLAILLNEFEVQLCEDEYFDAVLPPARELSFGMLQPLDKVALRIRKQTFAGAEATRKL